MKIWRREAKKIERTGSWILLYGRRKTGKTFIIKNFIKYDSYFYVRRDGVSLSERTLPRRIERAEDMIQMVGEMLKADKTVVIDEFQHLPPSLLEELSTYHPHGKLILSGSSMRVVNEIFSANSPLLGMLSEIRVGLISPGDLFRDLNLQPERSINYGAYIRDPWTIPMFSFSGDFLKDLWSVIEHSKNAIPALIGEIFSEEEKRQSRIYDTILRLIGAGAWSSKEVAHILYLRGIIERDDSRLIASYLRSLKEMDLIEEIPLFGMKKRVFYRVKSPVMETFYYLADRHNIEEREVSFGEIKENLRKMANLAVERLVADAMAELYGGNREYSLDPEIDFIITEGRKRKVIAVGEVKWGANGRKGARTLMEKTAHMNVERIVFSKRGESLKGVKSITPKTLIEEFKRGTTPQA